MAEDKSKQPAEDEALVKRVDEMMEPVRQSKARPAPPKGPYQPKKAAAATGAPPVKGVYKPQTADKPPIVIKLDDGPLATEPAAAAVQSENLPAGAPLDDQKTDEAVDDIAAKESDTILALEDARAARRARALGNQKSGGWKDRLKGLPKNKWTWIGLLVILIIIFALPFTRYPLLGLAIKKPVTVTVLDSKTGTPVSSALVKLGAASAKTDAAGQAHLKAALGKHTLQISKQYYSRLATSYFVGFKATVPVREKLVATGRLVPISIVNSITGQPLQNALIKVKNTSAKTNSKGLANIALPASPAIDNATITLNGYDQVLAAIKVTNKAVITNEISLTPAGQIYFLSNASGTIDVVRANLNGSDRKTILAGTGKEDPNNTSLLASRDWRYLVLEASRDGGQPALYLIDTSSGKLTEFENSGADIRLIGWYGHDFIYDLTKSSQSYWQPGREVLKSYDADRQETEQLDQNQAEGSATAYAYQIFDNFNITGGLVVYSTQWQTFESSGNYDTTGKSDSIRAVQPNGQNRKDYQTLPVDTTGYIQSQPYSPGGVYFSVYDNDNGLTTYYNYSNQSVSVASIDSGTFNASYPTYMVSPSGSQTLWSELRDGQNTLFVGDANANSKKPIASGYLPYGWYGNYVLASKDSSQLYILPASGLKAGRQPLKITDYYKPAQSFAGYGYGYGGL